MNDLNPYSGRINKLADVGDISFWGASAIDILRQEMAFDPTHDEGHIVRVVRNALWFGEGGDVNVIVPAAILHDLVNVPKDSPDRSKASNLSARRALTLLTEAGMPSDTKAANGIFHAIEAHSWSAGVLPMTLEAKAVQDADRIESLGYIGFARLFATSGALGRTLFHPTDPLASNRELDEKTYGLDHYFVKLAGLADTMQTARGQHMAQYNLTQMRHFVGRMAIEILG